MKVARAVRASMMAEMLRTSPTIYILCGNATYNRGDQANLASQIRLLRSRYAGARVVVESFEPARDSGWYAADFVPRPLYPTFAQLRRLRQADAVVWGGGALIADNGGWLQMVYWILLLGFVKGVLRKPVFAWGHGIVIETALGRALGSMAYRFADSITVRDAGSARALRFLGVPAAKSRQTADCAVLFAPSGADAGLRVLDVLGVPQDGRPLTVIAPTFWHYYHRAGDALPFQLAVRMGLRRGRLSTAGPYLRALRKAADLLVGEREGRVLFLPRYPVAPWKDVQLLEEVRAGMRFPGEAYVLTGEGLPPEECYAVFHHARCVLSVALHDAIVATAMGIPCVQIPYEEKCTNFAEAAGLTEWALPFADFLGEGGPEAVVEKASRLCEEWEHGAAFRKTRIARLQQAARANADCLADLLQDFSAPA